MFALQVEKAANIIDYVFNQGGGGGGDIYSGTSGACSCCKMVEEKACSCLGTCSGSS